MAFSIGSLTLKEGLLLAPMAGVTDAAYRAVMFDCGCELAVTEMVSARALCYEDKKTGSLLSLHGETHPVAVQLFGNDPALMAEAAARVMARPDAPVMIDLNMGCPVKKIVGNGEGSALMLDPPRAGAIVKAVSDAVSCPVTVKFRTGWDAEHLNAVEMARICEANGADAVCVHGRTREQLYADPVDRKTIAAVKAAVSIPVIGNGSLYTAEDIRRMRDETGCDGVALARGTMGNPFLFEEARGMTDSVSPSRILSAALKQLDLMFRYKEEGNLIGEARRQMSYYIRGVRGAASARDRLMRAESRETMEEILHSILRET